jgi:hypothetical protein
MDGPPGLPSIGHAERPEQADVPPPVLESDLGPALLIEHRQGFLHQEYCRIPGRWLLEAAD